MVRSVPTVGDASDGCAESAVVLEQVLDFVDVEGDLLTAEVFDERHLLL